MEVEQPGGEKPASSTDSEQNGGSWEQENQGDTLKPKTKFDFRFTRDRFEVSVSRPEQPDQPIFFSSPGSAALACERALWQFEELRRAQTQNRSDTKELFFGLTEQEIRWLYNHLRLKRERGRNDEEKKRELDREQKRGHRHDRSRER